MTSRDDAQRLSLLRLDEATDVPITRAANDEEGARNYSSSLRHVDSYGSFFTCSDNGGIEDDDEDLLLLEDEEMGDGQGGTNEGGGVNGAPKSGEKDKREDGASGIVPTTSNGHHDEEASLRTVMSPLHIVCILSTAFAYGCILTTLFMITLPLECERIHLAHPNIPTSVALGLFVAIAGVTQLVSPFVGRLSDTYVPPALHELGQRMPYLVLGSALTVAGLVGQFVASFYGFWMRYSVSFFLHMVGLNIMYSMMLSLIPDQVQRSQTGFANGVLALLLVVGSLFGFGLFHSFLYGQVQSMYGLYVVLIIFSTTLTGTHAHDKDAELTFVRVMHRRQSSFRRNKSPESANLGQLAVESAAVTPEPKPPQQPEGPAASGGAGTGEASPLNGSPGRRKLRRKRRRLRWHRVATEAARHAHHVIVLTPTVILKSVLVDPIHRMDWSDVMRSYTIDVDLYHDFAVVTLSRLFYYCGMSVQTFFLYFVQDVVGVRDNPESAVAALAIVGQVAGSLVPLPVGYWSDHLGGPNTSVQARRVPFVYFSCAVLGIATLSLLLVRDLQQMTVACFVLGAANGMYLTMDTSLAVDTLPSEFEGDSGSAQLLGVWGVAAFLGATLGPMIGGPLLYFVGAKDPDPAQIGPAREEYSLAGYAVLLSLSATYFLLSAATLRLLRPPSSSQTRRLCEPIRDRLGGNEPPG
jgi:Major Facilitator Superfamily